MSNYKKSAKDIAFDKERQKFQREIKRLTEKDIQQRVTMSEQLQHIRELEKEIEKLKESINYLSRGNYSPEELTEHMERTERLDKMFSIISVGL